MRHVGPPMEAAAASAAFDRVLAAMRRPRPGLHCWIMRDRGGRRVGLIAVVPDEGDACGELGLLFPHDRQGRGYATEAVRGLLQRLPPRPGADVLWARHRPGNAGVVALMRRLGFEPLAPVDGLWRWRLAWPAAVAAPADGFEVAPKVGLQSRF